MSGSPLKRRVKVANPQGFHMRPQSLFVQRAKQFVSTVTLAKNDQRVNGKSQWELMLLAAEQGAELELEVSGPDAAEAIDALAEIIESASADELPNSKK